MISIGTNKLANVTTTSYLAEGLNADTEYCFTITAVNGETESEKSAEACAKTLKEEQIEAPKNLEAWAPSLEAGVLSLKWIMQRALPRSFEKSFSGWRGGRRTCARTYSSMQRKRRKAGYSRPLYFFVSYLRRLSGFRFCFREGAAAVILTVQVIFCGKFAGTAIAIFLLEIRE